MFVNSREKIENKLSNYLDELDSLEEMSYVLIVKAKLECLKICAEVLAKIKSSGEPTQSDLELPSF